MTPTGSRSAGGRLLSETGKGANDDGGGNRDGKYGGRPERSTDLSEVGSGRGDLDIADRIGRHSSPATRARTLRGGAAASANAPTHTGDRNHGDAISRDRLTEDRLNSSVAAHLGDEARDKSRPMVLFGRVPSLLFWCRHGDRLLRVEEIGHEAGLRTARRLRPTSQK
jgi:hypothetical protein